MEKYWFQINNRSTNISTPQCVINITQDSIETVTGNNLTPRSAHISLGFKFLLTVFKTPARFFKKVQRVFQALLKFPFMDLPLYLIS